LTLAAVALALSAQQGDVTIPVDVTRARVDVRVAHRHSDEAFTGLTAADFSILENGRTTSIRSVDRETTPLDLILMIDASDSMKSVAEDLAQASKDLLATFGPEDRVAITEFAGAPNVLQGLTRDREKAAEAIARASANVGILPGATATFDAVVAAMDLYEGQTPLGRRRAVLVVTDDIDNSSHAGLHDVIAKLLEKDVVMNTVVIGSASTTATKGIYKASPVRFIMPMKSLKPVTEETGGEFLSGHRAVPMVKNVLEDIRSRYLITYVPGAGEGCARISTELSRDAKSRYPDAVVHGPRHRMGGEPAVCKW
jgi:VWFA-related protein